MQKILVSAIAAIGKHRELGKSNELLWTISDDLKRFRSLTRGHPVIMGRKTFESILTYTNGKPLPDRPNIVVTRSGIQGGTLHDEIMTVSSIGEAIGKAKEFGSDEVFIIGGAQIYAAALPFIDKLYLTLIDASKDADSFFPEYERDFRKLSEEEHEWNGLRYRWVDFERMSEV